MTIVKIPSNERGVIHGVQLKIHIYILQLKVNLWSY